MKGELDQFREVEESQMKDINLKFNEVLRNILVVIDKRFEFLDKVWKKKLVKNDEQESNIEEQEAILNEQITQTHKFIEGMAEPGESFLEKTHARKQAHIVKSLEGWH